jgi:sulfate adenylyltransferase
MLKLNLNQNQFSDLLNLSNDVFFPLKKFVNKNEFEKILNKLQYKKKFYPYPIFFGINKYTYKKIINAEKLNFYYKSKLIASISNINFFNIDKKKFGKTIYGKNYINHPYFKKFNSENFMFMNFKISKIYKFKINKKIFISPKQFLKSIDENKIKSISAFHTRNIPHRAHEWIHRFLLNESDMLLIHPLIGQYKKR